VIISDREIFLEDDMAKYWLGEAQLDRWVLRSLRGLTNLDALGVHKEVCRRMLGEGAVKPVQFLPDENDVWCSLQRLSLRRRVDKLTVNDMTGNHIHYRVNVRW